MLTLRRRDPVVLHLAVAVNALALGVIISLLAEIQDSNDLANAALGLIAGVGSLTSFFAYLVVAKYADRGYARGMLMTGSVLSATGLLFFGFSTGLGVLIASRALLGLAGGMFVPAARFVAIDWRPGKPGEVLGGMTAATVGGFAVGPILGTMLANRFGLQAPFLVTAALLLAVTPYLYRLRFPHTRSSSPQHDKASLLKNRLVLAGIALGAVDFSTVAVIDALWARTLTDQGAAILFIGASYSLALASTILFAPRFGRLADRRSPIFVAQIGLIAVVLGLLGYGFLNMPSLLAGAALIHAFGCSALAPAAAALVVQGSPNHIAQGQGVLRASAYLAAALFAFPSGWAYDHLGRPIWFGCLAVVSIGLTAVAAKLVADHPPEASPL